MRDIRSATRAGTGCDGSGEGGVADRAAGGDSATPPALTARATSATRPHATCRVRDLVGLSSVERDWAATYSSPRAPDAACLQIEHHRADPGAFRSAMECPT